LIDPNALACGPGGIGDYFVPDKPKGYDFSKCCHKHDNCYSNECSKSRKQCDDNFFDCMIRECNRRHLGKKECYNLAAEYWYWVDKYGGGSFNRARKKKPCCQKP
jgi:hypothetical protein